MPTAVEVREQLSSFPLRELQRLGKRLDNNIDRFSSLRSKQCRNEE